MSKFGVIQVSKTTTLRDKYFVIGRRTDGGFDVVRCGGKKKGELGFQVASVADLSFHTVTVNIAIKTYSSQRVAERACVKVNEKLGLT